MRAENQMFIGGKRIVTALLVIREIPRHEEATGIARNDMEPPPTARGRFGGFGENLLESRDGLEPEFFSGICLS